MQEAQETWIWSLGQEDPLEEEIATHSSILAGMIPWTRGAWQATQSMGSWRVEHNWGTELTHKHYGRTGKRCSKKQDSESSHSSLWVTCIGMFVSSSPLDYKLFKARDCVNFNRSLKQNTLLHSLWIINEFLPGFCFAEIQCDQSHEQDVSPKNHLYNFPMDSVAD